VAVHADGICDQQGNGHSQKEPFGEGARVTSHASHIAQKNAEDQRGESNVEGPRLFFTVGIHAKSWSEVKTDPLGRAVARR
jgi:hypothetical protein